MFWGALFRLWPRFAEGTYPSWPKAVRVRAVLAAIPGAATCRMTLTQQVSFSFEYSPISRTLSFGFGVYRNCSRAPCRPTLLPAMPVVGLSV